MKLYCTSGEVCPGMDELEWTGTQKDAKEVEKQMKARGINFVGTTTVDVPTDKAGLIEFLNKNGLLIEENGDGPKV